MPTKASGWSLYIKTKTLMNCKLITLTILSAFSALTNAADKVTITLTNTLSTPRTEMVETKLADVQRKLNATTNIIITDPNGQEIPSQATHDGKLIFQAGVPAKGKAVYYATKGTPQKYAAKVAGRLFTERQDEFGWENDKVAYRIYGHGGAVGYDLFNKNTSDLMLDYWYASEQNQDMRRVIKDLGKRGYKDLADQVYNAYCYHINHGKGMDCYTVGPTLGGGANALMEANGNLLMPSCYKSYKILDQGPLRFTVELTYPERQLNGAKVIEKRVITLDAGSHFNRVAVTYQGLPKPMTVAAGNARLMEKLGIAVPAVEGVGTIVHVAVEGSYAGYLLIADVVKPHSAEAIRALKASGVRKTVMLTGDAQPVAQAVAQQLGLDEYHAGLLPGDKVDQIEKLLAEKQPKENLAFVGDGINDAPVTYPKNT